MIDTTTMRLEFKLTLTNSCIKVVKVELQNAHGVFNGVDVKLGD